VTWPLTVSQHRGYGPLHVDVLVGAGPRCRTWRFERTTRGWVGRPIQAHRRRYLTWSGPVPGGRGVVRVQQRVRASGVVQGQNVVLFIRSNPLKYLGLGNSAQVFFSQRGRRVVQLRSAVMIRHL
jgi:hypothetical protein